MDSINHVFIINSFQKSLIFANWLSTEQNQSETGRGNELPTLPFDALHQGVPQW